MVPGQHKSENNYQVVSCEANALTTPLSESCWSPKIISFHLGDTDRAFFDRDIVSSPQEISLVCRNLQPYVPSLLLDQFGNYAAQLCLRFFSPMCDFLFDAMIDRCW